MAGDWLAIDWEEARPSEEDLFRSRARLRYEPVPVGGPATDDYLSAVRVAYANGGAVLARFRAVDADATLRWFATRNRFDEYGLFTHLLSSPALRDALPQLRMPEYLDRFPAENSWTGTLTLAGELAAVILHGGAYRGFGGTAVDALWRAERCVTELIGDRHEDFQMYRSHAAWSPWFFDVAWDMTWVLIDGRAAEITLLCLTDTD